MKPRLQTLPQKPLRVLVCCILGLVLIMLVQTANSAADASPPATAVSHQPTDIRAAEVLTSTDPTQRTHPSSANPPSCRPQVTNSSSAQDIELIGHIGGPSYAVSVQEDYVYAGAGPELTVLDISDPSHPRRVAYVVLPDYVYGVHVADDYAYVADNNAGLRVIDVSDPTAPTEVGAAYDTPGGASDVHVADGYAYVADGNAGLRVINVSDPTAPAEVGVYDTLGDAAGVYVAGGYAYVADHDAGLRVIDVSDPAAPAEVGAYDTPGDASGVHVAGSYAYLGGLYVGLRVIDISDPAAPTEVGVYNTPGYASGVHVADGYAYVAAERAGLRVIDVSDPAAPTEVGAYDTPGYASGVHVAGGYAYVAAGGAGLRVIDVSDPAAPTELGAYYTVVATDVYVAGGYAYLGTGYAYAGLRVIDVSDPTAPTEVGIYNTPGGASDVYVAGGYAYVANHDAGLYVLQFTGTEITYSITGQATDDTSNPVPSTTVSTTGPVDVSATTAGDGTYTLSDLPAGTYSISASKAGYLFSPTSRTVTVPPDATGVDFTGTPVSNVAADPVNSTVTVSPESVPANGTTEIQITVTLRDSDGNPVSGKVVQVLSSRGGQDTIAQPATPTNTAGQTTATIRSDTAGTAELTVLDLTDNVELAQKPTVTFTPYTPLSGDFLESIDRLTSQTVQQLDNLDSTTYGIAEEGTYFRLAIGQHAASGVLNATFGMLDLFGGLSDLNQADEAVQLALPGIRDGGWDRLFTQIEPYPYTEQYLQDWVYHAMRAGRTREVVNAIGWGGPKFFAAHAREAAIETLAEWDAEQVGKDIFAQKSDGMLTVAYPSVKETVQQTTQLVTDQKSTLLANMPPLTRAEQDAYTQDLWRRQLVPWILVQQAARQHQTLQQVHQVHQIGSNNKLVEFALRLSANLLATGFFDGPGRILVGGGLGAFDTYLEAQKLDESQQMYSLAWGEMNSIPTKLAQIPINAIKGLSQGSFSKVRGNAFKSP